MVIFHSFLYVYQRVLEVFLPEGIGGFSGSVEVGTFAKSYS